MRFCAPIAAALLGLVLATTARAITERVVLVRPEAPDPVLLDAWNRLAAELRIHHFEVEIVEAGVGQGVPLELSNVARAENALAALALVQETGTTSVDVWLVDRVSGKMSMRRIAVRPGSDASSVLAIRAVDLLRGSLREYDPDERPPPDVVGVEAGPVPEAAVALSAPSAPKTRLFADVFVIQEGPGFGIAAGPALGLFHEFADRFEVGVLVAGPVLGAALHTSEGAASLQEELAWVELRVAAFRFRRFEAGVDAAFGGLLLDAKGQPLPPLIPKSDQVVSFAGALGLHAGFELTARISLGLSLRAMGTVPRLGVAVDTDRKELGLPFALASAGIAVGL